MITLKGIPASPGIAIGPAYIVSSEGANFEKKKIFKNSVDKIKTRDYNTDIRKDGHDPVHYIDFEIIVFSTGIMKEEVRPPED